MNKLEEYKNSLHTDPQRTGNTNSCYDYGFDAAIALDLPVKFHNWASSKEGIKKYQNLVIENGSHSKSEKELYQYWIDNIYKP